MKRVLLDKAIDNMVLAQDILDQYDRVLVTAGTTLRSATLALLRKHRVETVWVRDIKVNNQEITQVSSLISTVTRRKMTNAVQKIFQPEEKVVDYLPEICDSIDDAIAQLSSQENLLLFLTDIRGKSQYLYGHCVDVGVFAIVIGMAMGLSRDDIRALGIGGLLHDYGKIAIDAAILEKNGPLTAEEFEEVKTHVTVGYNLLKTEAKVDSRIALITLQHHERPDGRGYPWGATEREIHPLAKIVAVADVYDALTTHRVYRPAISLYDATRIINAGAGVQFDTDVVAAFNKVAAPFSIGCSVIMDNGLTGAVIRINTNAPARPVVWTRQGTINLYMNDEINIVAVV